ncbi:hypothetical protein FRC08_004226 [Ceratobasidium sp. 394]|nr:hypothetical protein FRC08_004226 [Ceratobasidium sp. 394]
MLIFGAGPTGPYLPVCLPILPKVLNQVGPNTFPPLPPVPVVDRLGPWPSGTMRVDTHIVDQAPTIPTTWLSTDLPHKM